MQKIRWFLLILVIVLVLVVVLQNNQQAEIHLLLHQRTLPLSIMLLSTAAIGFLFGALMTAFMLRRGKKAAAKKKPKQAVPSQERASTTAESNPLG